MQKQVMRKVVTRLMPALLVLYVIAYLDRVNVTFAQDRLEEDLGFSGAVYGFGAGIFFIGYFLLEVPSNLALHRFGARRSCPCSPASRTGSGYTVAIVGMVVIPRFSTARASASA